MTVSAIEFSRLGPPKLRLYAMRCTSCEVLSPWWEHHHCYACGGADMVEQELAGTGELTNYTVVYYPPRDFLGQEPYVVGHITMDEGVLMPAPVVGVAPEDIEVGSPGEGHPAPDEARARGRHLLLAEVRGRRGARSGHLSGPRAGPRGPARSGPPPR